MTLFFALIVYSNKSFGKHLVLVFFETKYKGEIPSGIPNFGLAADAASFILTQPYPSSKLCCLSKYKRWVLVPKLHYIQRFFKPRFWMYYKYKVFKTKTKYTTSARITVVCKNKTPYTSSLRGKNITKDLLFVEQVTQWSLRFELVVLFRNRQPKIKTVIHFHSVIKHSKNSLFYCISTILEANKKTLGV